MRKLGMDVERDAVQADPALHADADRGDLVLAAARPVVAANPDADAVVAALALDVEGGERADDPFFERDDEAAHVAAAALEVEHQVDDALARPVIGELPAAADPMHREARLDQLLRPRAGAGGVERRGGGPPPHARRGAAPRGRRAGPPARAPAP